MNSTVNIPSEDLKKDWIEKNIEKAIGQIMGDFNHKRPLPASITFHGIALKKFINILQGQSAYHPNPDGSFKFITIPIYTNNRLPYGTFVIERFKGVGVITAK